MRGVCLLLGLLVSCASVSPVPRATASAFAPGTPRAAVEARAGEPRRVRSRDHGQLAAFYEIRLVAEPARPAGGPEVHAEPASLSSGLARLDHAHGPRDLDRADFALEAASLAFELMLRRVSDSPAPAKPDKERDPPPPRLCRVEVVYDADGRVLHRRIVPLDDTPPEVESWADVPGPVGR